MIKKSLCTVGGSEDNVKGASAGSDMMLRRELRNQNPQN